jgi:uncharacterized membrane protein AbrB (regulator of aidB expression)
MLAPQRVHIINALCLILLGLIGPAIFHHIPEVIGVLLLAISPMLKAGQKIVVGMSLFLQGALVVTLLLALPFTSVQEDTRTFSLLRIFLMLLTLVWSIGVTYWVRVRMG